MAGTEGAFNFTIRTSNNSDDAQIAAQRLDSGERKILIRGIYARYVPTGPTGHLVYHRSGTRMN